MFAYMGESLGEEGSQRFLIKEIVKSTGCQNYLELGVWDGSTLDFIKPHVKKAIGVDVTDNRINKSSTFFQMTTDKFFSDFKNSIPKMDVIFIDADHTYESVKKDFLNSLDILNEFGIIILHDTDPMNLHYSQPGYCGNSYKMIDYITNEHPDLNIVTLPVTQTGISIVNRKKDRRVNKFL